MKKAMLLMQRIVEKIMVRSTDYKHNDFSVTNCSLIDILETLAQSKNNTYIDDFNQLIKAYKVNIDILDEEMIDKIMAFFIITAR